MAIPVEALTPIVLAPAGFLSGCLLTTAALGLNAAVDRLVAGVRHVRRCTALALARYVALQALRSRVHARPALPAVPHWPPSQRLGPRALPPLPLLGEVEYR